MANPGQPTISLSATGDAVKRLERALRRTPNPGLTVDGVFGPQVETAVKQFQQGAGLTVDGIVGPATWAALPDGGPMPTLQEGSTGAVVSSLQTLLTTGAGAVEHNAARDRWQFRAAYESLRCGVSGLGRRRAGRGGRRPDMGCFPCMRRAPRWKQRWAYSLWWVDPKRERARIKFRGDTSCNSRSCRSRRKVI
jgi:hypothetical protein